MFLPFQSFKLQHYHQVPAAAAHSAWATRRNAWTTATTRRKQRSDAADRRLKTDNVPAASSRWKMTAETTARLTVLWTRQQQTATTTIESRQRQRLMTTERRLTTE